MTTPQPLPPQIPALAAQLLGILYRDREHHLMQIDDYLHGKQADPYMPDKADQEYRLLAKRSVLNLMPLVVQTPAQCLYVDGFRRGADRGKSAEEIEQTPEWQHWQYSGLDSRQTPITRAALGYGHAFTLTEKDAKGNPRTKGLSPLRTSALFEDPANDIDPAAMLTVLSWPSGKDDSIVPGRARVFDGPDEYAMSFKVFAEVSDPKDITITFTKRHETTECPGTRFPCAVDLDGRTVGLVEPLIVTQDRINQTVFDLLIAQTYNSFQVRTVTGMSPPILTKPVYQKDDDGNIVKDDDGHPVIIGSTPVINPRTGNPVVAPIDYNARRFLFAADPETKFGSLAGTALDGYIAALEMNVKHLSAISQTPPHYLLGQIANLSAEALDAAEVGLLRKTNEFRKVFGEAWERVFRLAAQLSDDTGSAEDFAGEVIWRDTEQRNLAQAADALGKLCAQLGIPPQGLWKRVPGVTETEIAEWESLILEEADNPKSLAAMVRKIIEEEAGEIQQQNQNPDPQAVPNPVQGNPLEYPEQQ